MELGWFTIIPPIIAIGLAIATKKVVPSLIAAILIGAFMVGGNTLTGIFTVSWDMLFEIFTDWWYLNILLFLVLLGIIVAMITSAGGSAAYAAWASKHVKSRVGAQIATLVLGIIIFIDDYFNSLTVGTVMKPISDQHRISRAKLAYIIDSTAAPVTILVPVSSWVATLVGSIADTSVTQEPFAVFLRTIPYNIYGWIAILMVLVLSVTNLEFGPMAKHERIAIEKGNLHGGFEGKIIQDSISNMEAGSKGKIFDLVVPVAGLVVFTIISMVVIGYQDESTRTVWESFGNTDSSLALRYGGIAGLILCLVMFLPRKLITPKQLGTCTVRGFKAMAPALIILVLAWTIGGIIGELGTGEFLASFVEGRIPVGFIPAILFIFSGLIAFSTGTSWGTFGMMIPISVPIAMQNAPELIVPAIAAVIAGAVYGDHCCPISDTTILSSTGAGCSHIDHVNTQLPYATTAALVSFIGYIIAGYTKSAVLSLFVSVALILGIMFLLHKFFGSKDMLIDQTTPVDE